MSTANPSPSSFWLAMVVPHGRAIHALEPSNDLPFCTNASEKWSQHPVTLKPLNRTGEPTCHYCRHVLGLGG